jgi:arylformamidase
MKLYDISVDLSDTMPVWPEELAFSRKENHFHSVCVSEVAMSLHAGTHLDAPYHFLPNGRKISDFSLERFVGKARVCNISDEQVINVRELEDKNLYGVEKLLFKTKNSELWTQDSFVPDFIGLELDAAKYLVSLGVQLVGTDYLSIEAYGSKDNPVHKTLLENEVLILEGLNLSEVPEGDYSLVCCPLKILGAEASPARAFLMPLDQEDGKNISLCTL